MPLGYLAMTIVTRDTESSGRCSIEYDWVNDKVVQVKETPTRQLVPVTRHESGIFLACSWCRRCVIKQLVGLGEWLETQCCMAGDAETGRLTGAQARKTGNLKAGWVGGTMIACAPAVPPVERRIHCTAAQPPARRHCHFTPRS